MVNNKIFLNEINFRHSGSGFALIKNGINIPYIWYLNNIGVTIDKEISLKKREACFISEISDFKLFKEGSISFHSFISDMQKAKSYAIIDKRDLRGTFAFFIPLVRNKLKKKKCIYEK